jgi:hypothetical protein
MRRALLTLSLIVSVFILMMPKTFAILEGPGSGLVGWWKFDEGAGSMAYDSSGSRNDGIIMGLPSWTAGYVSGSGGLHFDGLTNFVRIPVNESLRLGVKTVAVWVNLDGFLKRYGAIFGWGRGPGCADNYQGYVSQTGSFYASYQNTLDEMTIRPTTQIGSIGTGKLGEWAHYAFVYNSSGTNLTISLYKNGIIAGAIYSGTDGLSPNCAMTAIGSQEDIPNPGYVRTFSGTMDDYRVYNRALSVAEITTLYNQGRVISDDIIAPTSPTGLIAAPLSSYEIRLTWNQSSDNVGVAGYVIYRDGSPISTVQSETTYTDTAHSISSIFYYNIAPSTTYTYTVAAFDSAGRYSAQSSPASATTPAGSGRNYSVSVTMLGTGLSTIQSAPSGFSCTNGTCSIAFSEGATVILSPYPFVRGMWYPNIPPFSGWMGSGCSGIGECHLLMNSDKTVSAYYTIPVPTGADTIPPSTPTGITAAAVSSSQINLTWSASGDNFGVVGYRIYKSGVQIATVSGTAYSDTGLLPATLYSYSVSAYDSAGLNSTQSSSASATTFPVATGATNHYVSPTGTAEWEQCTSIGTPCPLATANTNAVAGDTVYLRGGTYSGITGSAINPSNTGTAGNMITFSAYNGEDVQIIGSGANPTAVNLDSDCQPGGEHGPCAVTRNYIKVTGLHFSHFNRQLWIRYGSHNEISYCFFIGMPDDTSNLEWAGTYIYRNSYYNWIHHNTFGDFGQCEPYGNDYGVVFQMGLETLPDYDISNSWLTKYNLVEYNNMYHGGHHVVSFYGVNNVFRYNAFRNDPWCPLNNPQYATRTTFQTGTPGDGEYNLVEGNRIGYGGPKNKDEIGGAGGTIAGANNIWRKNIYLQVYTDAMWITHYEGQSDVTGNKIYNNVYWHGGYGRVQSAGAYWDWSYTHAIDIDTDDATNSDNAFKNNLFYQNSDYYGTQYSIISLGTRVAPTHQILANNWLDNAGDPKFVDISGTPVPAQIETQFDFHLQPNSPCIDKGAFLTTVTSASGSGTQFQVADAGYFMDGWGIAAEIQGANVSGDVIQLQGQTQRALIINVNYDSNTITVNTSMNWTAGQGVNLAYEGSAPDIGAYEYNGNVTVIPGDANGDGIVNLQDLTLVAENLGKMNYDTRADLDGNAAINLFDVMAVVTNWGRTA